MGDLIVMTRPTGSRRLAPPQEGSAEILFFTGVRYYRMSEEQAAAPVAPRRKRRSRKSDIAEAVRLERQA